MLAVCECMFALLERLLELRRRLQFLRWWLQHVWRRELRHAGHGHSLCDHASCARTELCLLGRRRGTRPGPGCRVPEPGPSSVIAD